MSKKLQYKLLGKAIKVAAEAHEGQYDKSGKPYMLHPLHLMNQVLSDPELAIIAILHDVVEDTKTTLSELVSMGFSQRVIDALVLLTHEQGVSYEEYVFSIASKNIDAIKIKLLDLEHNSCITRLKGIRDKDIERIEKYHKAYLMLKDALGEP